MVSVSQTVTTTAMAAGKTSFIKQMFGRVVTEGHQPTAADVSVAIRSENLTELADLLPASGDNAELAIKSERPDLEPGAADLAAVVRSFDVGQMNVTGFDVQDGAGDVFAGVQLPTRRHFLDPSFTAKCPLCEKLFSTYQGFMRHVDQHRGRFAFFCSVCGRGFMTKDHLGNHMRGHTGERLYCQCGVGFKTHQALRMHRKRERHDQNSIRYDDKWLTWSAQASADKTVLLPMRPEGCLERTHICTLCNKSFGSKFSYSRHMAQHWGRFTYSCDLCGQGFMVKGSLENHRRNHTGERLVCICGAKFVSYQGYRQHQRKYNCLDKSYHSHCSTGAGRRRADADQSRSDGRPVDMDKMWSIALDVFARKPFSRQCETCKKTFTTMHGYSTHVSQHRGQFKYTCDICGQGFMVKGSMENHVRNHTGERLVCHCGASYISYQGYKRHVKKHEQTSSAIN